ncbi:MAG: glycosyl hydrolase 53 family protein, partial [Asticcacaulis sp.]|nr:glycosyl hydrolase 53 family protein [Asticcacaulis sp.]
MESPAILIRACLASLLLLVPTAQAQDYVYGADVGWVTQEEALGYTFKDSAGVKADPFVLLKDYGVNAIRLRVWVDPKDGWNGKADTLAKAKRAQAQGQKIMIDFHYSDNWADPGKQCVPVGWQGLTTIADLAKAVQDYTKNAVATLLGGGARPDMIQVGNEITPGMLLHRCDGGGQPTGSNPIT